MADALSNDVAISLLGNTIATGTILFVLITIFGPVSGAHFNPAVSFVFYLRGDLAGGMTLLYMIVQVCGGILGTWTAHAMFEVPILQISTVDRSGFGNCISEIIATFGLVFVIFTAISQNSNLFRCWSGCIFRLPIGSLRQHRSPTLQLRLHVLYQIRLLEYARSNY